MRDSSSGEAKNEPVRMRRRFVTSHEKLKGDGLTL